MKAILIKKDLLITLLTCGFIIGLLIWVYSEDLGLSLKDSSVFMGKGKKISLKASQVEVSSVDGPTVGRENLIDGNVDTFWHVKNPKERNEEWLQIDLLEKEVITGVRILARKDASQLWSGNNAVWEGSNDGQNWQDLLKLSMEKKKINKGKWVEFLFPTSSAFQYYRIKIKDPSFFSIAELEIYVKE
jgi:hypothetical protein